MQALVSNLNIIILFIDIIYWLIWYLDIWYFREGKLNSIRFSPHLIDIRTYTTAEYEGKSIYVNVRANETALSKLLVWLSNLRPLPPLINGIVLAKCE